MSDTEQTPDVPDVPVAPVKKQRGRAKGTLTEAQLEGLKKGMAFLKAKRELIAQKKADGTYDPNDPEVQAKSKTVTVPKKRGPPPLPRQIIEVPRKERPPVVRQTDLDEIRNAVKSLAEKINPVERIVEKEVEKIVEKPVDRIVEKKLTGRELLDSIFFR